MTKSGWEALIGSFLQLSSCSFCGKMSKKKKKALADDPKRDHSGHCNKTSAGTFKFLSFVSFMACNDMS